MKIIKKYRYTSLSTAVAIGCMGLATASAQAQQEENIEEITVTGSFIERPADRPQPVQIIDNELLQMEQKNSISEIFKNLPQSTGNISSVNTQEGGGNTPTKTINLRGLGARATLVLLNGKRQTIDGSGTGVDVDNLSPAIMIDRVEILTDGASAIYGSDAVAGVVNYITRRDFEGAEMRMELQQIQETEADQPDSRISFIAGTQGDNSGVVAGLEIAHTEILLAQDMWDAERLKATLQSSFANPGSFVPGPVGSPVAGRFPDPLCGDDRFSGPTGLQAGIPTATSCTMVNSLGRTLQPDSTRINGLAVAHHEFDNGIGSEVEIGFANTEYEIPFGFVTPLLFPLPVVPANNPGVIAANAADPNFVVQPYRWWGRPLSPLDGRTGAIHTSRQDTYRMAATFDGPIFDSGWQWSLSGTTSRNQSEFNSSDALNSRFLNAIGGYGGPGCGQTPESDPAGDAQGQGQCQWYNPFGNHALASPGDPAYNDPALLDFIIGSRVQVGDAKLRTVNGLLSGEVFEMAGGVSSLAIGYQMRRQEFSVDWDDITNGGFNANTGQGFRFNQDAFPDFSGVRDTDSYFAELVMYPTDDLELQMAVRREEFSRAESTDPKISALWTPTENLFLRATVGSSFRMPREIQMFGRSSGGSSVRTIGGEGINARGVVLGNENLKPEESDNWTLGFTWDVTSNFSLTMDYWDVEFQNLVTSEDADILINNDIADGFIDNPQLVIRDGRPNEVCEVTGRWDPDSGDLLPADCFNGTDFQTIVTSYINQDFQNTSGVDFSADYNWDAMGSEWNLRLNGSWTNEYDVFTTGQQFDGVGSFNSLNFGVPNAEWRTNLSLTWRMGEHFARATWRYISALKEDDQAGAPLTQEQDWNSMDIVAGTTLPWGVDLTASITNIFAEEDPVRQTTLLPTETSIYDYRQRVFRVGISKSFQ